MSDYLIISGTNRKGAKSYEVAVFYKGLLKSMGVGSDILDLADLPEDSLESALYEKAGTNEYFNELISRFNKAKKIIFVVAEYNGSFPGALEVFIDGLDYPDSFLDKKAALIGISSGDQGAALALSHLADILSYLGTHVLAYRPRIPALNQQFEDGEFTNEKYEKILKEQAIALIEF